MNEKQLHELLYQSLEVEMGGQRIYQKAIECAVTPELKNEFEKYYDETKDHERILREVFQKLGLDADQDNPGRQVARHKADSLVRAMDMALKHSKEAAELVAAESVVEAETKDHQDWELIGALAQHMQGEQQKVLMDAYKQVEDQEDEHLFHTMGWARELWMKSLGLPAAVPPPEEKQHVKSMAAAGKAWQERQQQLKR